MIRKCLESDFKAIFDIINDAASAYKGVIPDDRWHEPYMTAADIRREIADGVVFWGCEKKGELLGVMGIQGKGDVTLIRHAYVRTRCRQQGIGKRLLVHLESLTAEPILVGTWKAAYWAVAFYQKNGYVPLSNQETDRLLRKYWSIPERQIETSVVLANRAWKQR